MPRGVMARVNGRQVGAAVTGIVVRLIAGAIRVQGPIRLAMQSVGILNANLRAHPLQAMMRISNKISNITTRMYRHVRPVVALARAPTRKEKFTILINQLLRTTQGTVNAANHSRSLQPLNRRYAGGSIAVSHMVATAINNTRRASNLWHAAIRNNNASTRAKLRRFLTSINLLQLYVMAIVSFLALLAQYTRLMTQTNLADISVLLSAGEFFNFIINYCCTTILRNRRAPVNAQVINNGRAAGAINGPAGNN